MNFRIDRILNMAMAVVYTIVVLALLLQITSSSPNEPRVIYPLFIISIGIMVAFFINREMRLFYLQLNPKEEYRLLKAIGFLRIKEDYVRLYPNNKIIKLYQACIAASLFSIIWIFIEVVIDASR